MLILDKLIPMKKKVLSLKPSLGQNLQILYLVSRQEKLLINKNLIISSLIFLPLNEKERKNVKW